MLERRYGNGFLDHVRRTIEASGFRHAPPPVAPRSRMALELGELARTEGCHDAVHTALFHAYWSEGRDIGDIDVLLAIAGDAGLDTERVRESTKMAHGVGVNAVPAWLVDDEVLVLGAQPHDVFQRVLADLGHGPVVTAGPA